MADTLGRARPADAASGASVRRWRVAAALALGLAALEPLSAAHPSAQNTSSTIGDLLNRYADFVTTGKPMDGPMGAIGGLDAVRSELERAAPAFAASHPPERARRILAAFALEIARVGVEHERAAAVRLIEWACRPVREHAPADDFDRRWQIAAMALIEAERDPIALDAHVAHVAAQFPDDPKVLLARAVSRELHVSPNTSDYDDRDTVEITPTVNSGQITADYHRRLEDALRGFKDALADTRLGQGPERAEAWMRTARLNLALDHAPDALQALAESDRAASDASTRYLVQLLRGRAGERLGKPDEARAAYRAALALIPGAHAATIALATLEFHEHQRELADGLMGGLIRRIDPPDDPWWNYWTGDFRAWPDRIARVREALR